MTRFSKPMRRNYDTAYYRDLLARVRQRLPDAAIGSDIIVGFPGESDAQFESSLEYFDVAAADLFSCFSLFVTARNGGGVVAGCSANAGQKSRAPKDARARRAKEAGLLRRICSAKLCPCWSKRKLDKATGFCRGFSRNYLPVVLAHAPKLSQSGNQRKARGNTANGWLRGIVDDRARLRHVE